MAGDEARVAANIESGFRFENARRGQTDRHQRRLRIGGQGQVSLRTFEHQSGQILSERAVDLGEDMPCRRILLGEGFAHADRLRPLPWKHESCQHRPSFVVGAETMLGAGCQESRRSGGPHDKEPCRCGLDSGAAAARGLSIYRPLTAVNVNLDLPAHVLMRGRERFRCVRFSARRSNGCARRTG
jgi:hypothetical protein